MKEIGESILRCLQEVSAERQARAVDPVLGQRVAAIKQYQHERFSRTYADLLAHKRYGGAAKFFLEDLYGPSDFSERDVQFARVVPALLRLFPKELIATVAELAALHALSERLDSAMARALPADPPIDDHRYALAWRAVGGVSDRERQITLMVSIGTALDRYTRNMLLRHSLRLMRGPAQAAGLAALQRFLETGFDTFRAMGGAREFLTTISIRERGLCALLFDGGESRAATAELPP